MGIAADTAKLLALLLHPGRGEARSLYDLLGTRNRLGEHSHYLNLGYWKDAASYDGACQALARLLGEAVEMRPGDQVLDAGFGFADQDIYWDHTFSPERIVGLNITPSQVVVARRRVAERGIEDRVHLLAASATAVPVASSTFDCVVALESAFHFVTREDFLREAYRVLRPGGRLGLADIIPLVDPCRDWRTRLRSRLLQSIWQVPSSNLYPLLVYEQKLAAAGFVDVRTRSIGEHVYAPLVRFARRRLHAPAATSRLSPVVRSLWRLGIHGDHAFDDLDYVIVRARKPAAVHFNFFQNTTDAGGLSPH